MGDSSKKKNIFYRLGGFFYRARLSFLQGFYAAHLKIRSVHDKKYQKGGWYKKWTDTKYSSAVHRATLISFVISFTVFTLAQSLWPYIFNPSKSREVIAGANTVIWTSENDFNNNASTTNTATTKSSVVVNSNGTVNLSSEYAKFANASTATIQETGGAVIKTDGSLYTWGSGAQSLGLGGVTPAYEPLRIGADNDWAKVFSSNGSGEEFYLAIKTNGTLWAWGANSKGQLGLGNTVSRNAPIQVGSDTNWDSVAVAKDSVYARKTNGTLWSWGFHQGNALGRTASYEYDTNPGQIGSATDWASVYPSEASGYAIKTNGTLWAWGFNFSGQLGFGDTNNRTAPAQVGAATNWAVVSGNGARGKGVKTDGTLWEWNGGTSTPSQVGTDTNWSKVSIGNDHYLFTKTNGTLWSYGTNTYGQLGIGNTTSQWSPVQVGSAVTWSDVNAGTSISAARKSDGTLWSWGLNTSGQLGTGDTSNRTSPVQVLDPAIVSVLSDVALISASDYGGDNRGFSIAKKSDGTLWSWGRNNLGQLGLGNTTDKTSPTMIGTGTNWANISAGSGHVIATRNDGTLWAWGTNGYGQLGLGDTTQRNSYVQVGTDNAWSVVSAGEGYSMAIKTDGTLWAWGYNGYGQLGIGNTTNQTTPIQVGSDTNWQKISAGPHHVLAIKTDSSVYSWGYNGYGQLGLGDSAQRTSPVRIGNDTDWSAVSAGRYFSIAKKTTGTLYSWGRNSCFVDEASPPDECYGSLGLGDLSDRNSPVQIGADNTWSTISTGEYHVLATKANGTLWSWGGANTYGELGEGSLRNSPAQIGSDTNWSNVAGAGSGRHSLGLRNTGAVWAWGSNYYGQLGILYSSSGANNAPVATKIKSFNSNYPSSGTLSALRIDAGVGKTVSWSGISWNSTALQASTSIAFDVRTSNDNTNWSANSNFVQNSVGSTSGSGSLSSLAKSRYLDITLTLNSSDITLTPTLNDFTITYDSIESPTNSNIVLTKSDGTPIKNSSGTEITGGVAGGFTNDSIIKVFIFVATGALFAPEEL